jgi:peptidyl-tRNA hydrolase, PTH1 family
MLLLVGLGNPGAEYVKTRHNVGFMAVQAIAQRHGIGPWRRRFQGLACEGEIGSVPTLLLLPGTYMNESGRAVAEAARFHKLPLDRITAFHDEIELHPAYVKVKVGGGNAGHNGLRSMSAALGNDFRRVGIGVGRPSTAETVEHYVLRNFEKSEQGWVAALLEAIADDADSLVQGEDKRFEDRVLHDMREAGFADMFRHGSSRPKRTKGPPGPPEQMD